jgi:hypothetical protein
MTARLLLIASIFTGATVLGAQGGKPPRIVGTYKLSFRDDAGCVLEVAPVARDTARVSALL